jgi:hypothetical protein
MRYLALACDYDGTLAEGGWVDKSTLRALERCRASGRHLVLVTGRELPDLQGVFPHLALFERVVAENGALLYRPSSNEETILGERPPERFIWELRNRNVIPLSVGKVIVATWQPNETLIVDLIRDLGLELQVIFNKGAVMVLPSGVNKALGLKAALKEMGLSPHNTVGIGDAENDHAFLALCECSVAVANGLAPLKERSDFVTQAPRGAGVAELIDELVTTDLETREPQLKRQRIPLGTRIDGAELHVDPFGENLLVAGPSGSGKSSLVMSVLETLTERGYQFCIVDPEGDYPAFAGALVLGDSRQEPNMEDLVTLLEKPEQNAVVNLLGVPLDHRPEFFMQMLERLQQLRARTGRPHWLILDEAHHVVPSSSSRTNAGFSQYCQSTMFITVHPEHVSPVVLSCVRGVVAVGKRTDQTLRSYGEAVGEEPPETRVALESGEGWFWQRSEKTAVRFRVVPPRSERRRHQRKYAEGSLSPEKSFYFRGPEGKLNLRAQNLAVFLQLAEGVDDATWLHHLRQGDYSRWFRESIKDEPLAVEAARAEAQPGASVHETRVRIKEEIEKRYTGPP